MLSVDFILTSINLLASLFFAILVLSRKNNYKHYFFINFCITIWCSFQIILIFETSLFVINILQKCSIITLLAFTYEFLNFSFEITKFEKNKFINIYNTTSLGILTLLAIFNKLNVNFNSIEMVQKFPIPSALTPLLILYFIINFSYGLKILSKISKIDQRIRYILVGSIFLFIGILNKFLLWYELHDFSFANLTVTIHLCMVSYAIIKHRILDLNVAISKGIAKLISIVTLVGIYFILNILYRQNVEFISREVYIFFNVIYLAIALESYPFIRKLIQNVPDQVFLKSQYKYIDTSMKLSSWLGEAITIQEFLEKLQFCFCDSIGLESVKLFVRKNFDSVIDVEDFFLLVDKKSGLTDAKIKLENDNPLTIKSINANGVLFYDDVEKDTQDSMDELDARASIPCEFKGKMIGIILLGGRKDGKKYSYQDCKLFGLVFSQIGVLLDRISAYSQLIVSLENARKSLSYVGIVREYVHELKTPLAILEGNISADANLEELRDLVVKQSQRSRKLLDTMLYIGSGQRRRETKKIDLNDIIKNVLLLFPKISSIVTDLKEIPFVEGDPEDLKVVFANLFKNAKTAMDQKDILNAELTVRTYADLENEKIYVSIEDNGIGMSEEKLHDIWKRFTTSKFESGESGLGLSVVKRVIWEHKGNIDLESKLGKGTKITIWFPIY